MASTNRSLAHHLRFARTLALVSSLGATASGCYASHTGTAIDDGGPAPDGSPADGAIADTGHDAAALSCETCVCDFSVPPPANSCQSAGLSTCCATIGPLAPPDLAV
jgi:hypothetical protein